MAVKKKKRLGFVLALQVYQGYLKGTHKADHTVRNYQFDILDFKSFLHREYGPKAIKVDQISQKDVEGYRDYLKEKGLKNNTRRRKILTVSQFIQFLAKRNKIFPENAQRIAAPLKIERIPYVVSVSELLGKIKTLDSQTTMEKRNRLLLWILLETGCLVSEICTLKFNHFRLSPEQEPEVHFSGKSPRKVTISAELYQSILDLKTEEDSFIFYGFNKFGPLQNAISSRGVELLVKAMRDRFGLNLLTPRTFRHSAIVGWLRQGIPQVEVQRRLGLKSVYAFRSYRSLIKSSSETTSIS